MRVFVAGDLAVGLHREHRAAFTDLQFRSTVQALRWEVPQPIDVPFLFACLLAEADAPDDHRYCVLRG